MARSGFYPRPYPICDGSGADWYRTENGPEWTACGGCSACRPVLDQAVTTERGARGAALAFAATADLDDSAF